MLKIQAGNPVTGSAFIGRETEIGQIIALLKMGQSVVILAPRRFGKTSLVLEILRRMARKKDYTALVDVFATPTIPLLSTHIVEAVLKNHKADKIFTKSRHSAMQMIRNARLKAVLDEFEFILGFAEKEPDPWQLLGDSIDFIDRFATKHNRVLHCAFDEFGDVRKLDGDKIIKLFRSKIQQHKHATYLFSGSYESVMNAIFVTRSSPFYRFARIIRLGYIDRKAFIGQFEKHFRGQGITNHQDLSSRILNFTHGHPYYSQLALQETLIFHTLNNRLPSFPELSEILLNIERSYLEKTWEELAGKKESVSAVLAVLRSEKGIYKALQQQALNPYRALQALVNSGVLSRTESDGYRLNDPLLEHWIRVNVLRS
jgi:hypothetical protein